MRAECLSGLSLYVQAHLYGISQHGTLDIDQDQDINQKMWSQNDSLCTDISLCKYTAVFISVLMILK